MKILDLYAVAGGLTLGFAQAFGAAEFLPVERDADACKTYAVNFDRDVKPKDIAATRFERADIVIGGTPCQPFSGMNTARTPDDPRRDEWRNFMRAVDEAQPRVFVVENVPRFRLTECHAELMQAGESAGYTMRSECLTAADFGAATSRRRLFVVGIKGCRWSIPEPTNEETEGLFGLPRWVSIRDRIGDLPDPPQPADDAHAFSDSLRDRRRAASIPAGVDPFDWLRANAPETIAPVYLKPDARRGIWTGFRSWDWDKPAGSLLSQFFDHAKGQLHPSRKRALTLREASMLQGFPKKWRFFGNRKSVAKQIANAVPVELAGAVARSIGNAL